MTTEPLRNNWRLDEDKGFIQDQIKERVDSEANYNWCKNESNAIPKVEVVKVKSKVGFIPLLKELTP